MPALDLQVVVEDASRWEVVLPNRLPALMRAIEELNRRLEAWGAKDDTRYLLQLAVEELGTNILKYGYDDKNEHVIGLKVAREEGVFRICLEDDGHEFNPWQAPEPDPNLGLQERKPGGWGIALVRRLAAGIDYERRGNRNVVCVTVPRQT